MDIQFFTQNRFNPSIFIPAIRQEWKQLFEIKAFKEYDPCFHEIVTNSTGKRNDKTISVPVPGDCDDNPQMMTKVVCLNRLPLALQQLIVSRSAAFLTGGKIELKSKPSDNAQQKLYDAVKETWRKNKLDFKNNYIAETFMSQLECAEIWYSKKNADGTISMKCNIYRPIDGYDFVPVFDAHKDLLAFGLGYKTVRDKAEIEHMDIYDTEWLTRYEHVQSEWVQKEKIKLLYGKIPVIYYSINKSIWEIVQKLIERLEYLLSNFADSNDYTGSPILAASGQIKGFSAKGETGKVIELQDGDNGSKADLKYVTYDKAPEAIKLEIDTLRGLVFTLTQTPDLAFEQMKGLGDISGVAFDRLMIDAHLKSKAMQNGMYGECIQRRLNFLCYACAATNSVESAKDMEITAEFSLFSIDSVSDRIDNAKKANGGKPVIDALGGIKMAGLTDDPEGTLKLIQEETEAVKEEIPAWV